MNRIMLAALAAGFAAACSPAAAAGPEWKAQACPAAYAETPYKVECGTLTVDEARGVAGTRRISFPVVRVKALAPKAGLPPVVSLHGGPGGDVVDGLPQRLKSPGARELIAVDQDWVFFDERGTGGSSPFFDCPGTQLTDAGLPTDKDAAGVVACLKGYAAKGYDLSRYDAVEVARDVQDLRTALNMPVIDLYGASYGTRTEAAIQTHAPQGVRAVVQDSPWPPEASWTVGGPQMVSGALSIVMAKCAAQADCARRYPDLQARVRALAAKFLAGAQVVGGKTYQPDDMGGFLMEASYFAARDLPKDLDRMARGDFGPLDEFMGSREYYAEGQFFTHLCREELPFEDRAQIAAGAKGDPVAELLARPMVRMHEVCDAAGIAKADAVEQQPVRTSIPTLFLAAEIDPGCPPELTRAAAKGYEGSQVVIVVNATHGVTSQSPCARRMVRAFFADPTKPVDRSCLPAADAKIAFAL